MTKLLNVERLSREVRSRVEPYIRNMIELQGDNLLSAAVYGSAARGDFSPKTSVINLLFICGHVEMALLERCLKAVNKGIGNSIAAPLMMTREYMEATTDVFPIEFLDIKENHLLLYGKDYLSALEIDTAHLRLQCEQQIKGKLLRIQQAFLEIGLRRKGIEALLKESLTDLVPTFTSLLRLKGEKVPADIPETLRRLCALFGLSRDLFLELWHDAQEDETIGGQEAHLFMGRYLAELKKLAHAVDAL